MKEKNLTANTKDIVISASLIKELRDATGSAMSSCKQALQEAKGNIEEAIKVLRKASLAQMSIKSQRSANEGIVALAINGNKGAIIEIKFETDFVARNERLQKLAIEAAQLALSYSNLLDLKKAKLESGETLESRISHDIAIIGENIQLNRIRQIKLSNSGVIASYVHNSVAPNLGQIAVLVALEGNIESDKLKTFGKNIAMHIAATNPKFLSSNEVPEDIIMQKKEIFTAQARATGKPEKVIEKMIEGRVSKFLEETVLLEQTFVIDGKSKISEVLSNATKEFGSEIRIIDFSYLKAGEIITEEGL
ncbi:translation elongation factor Ts [Orientia chuto str. Dubai]|uniref:Elongation factor Ts n=1 Tax=Orientia chuto str. Dubai TaxID=1359168 RepID=A0A0F3MN96_9RICK|nr:translation elongation factor Ts [Candidatus Orientia mediorientalis]KJV57248.1 translation elongation factor Ts [Orientia chuto str. Dubai]